MSYDLLGIFGAGLATFVAPCVLPLVPIYLGALVGTDIREIRGFKKGQLLFRASMFSLGFLLVFTLLGLTASSIGAFLVTNKSLLMGVGALLIMVFGLKFLGVIQIPWLERTVQADERKLKTRFSGVNALILGVVFAAGWSPCAGPVLGSVLTYTASTTSDPLTGALYLGVYGLGFALPLLVVAVFAEAGLRLLKKIGPHLPKIERVLGVLLLVVAGALLHGATAVADVQAETGPCTTEPEALEPTLLIFTAEDCQVCKQMRPLIDRLTQECHGKKVLIEEVDVSSPSGKRTGIRHRLLATPTFVFLDREGGEAARLVGAQTEMTLKQALSALRGEPCPGLELLPGQTRFELPDDDPQSRGAACDQGDAPVSEDAPPAECTDQPPGPTDQDP